MSTTIDQRVAELRFDNSHFEKNVSTTMSTLDKLKEKLNLDGASKGLSDIDKAARNVNMGGLASGIELVGSRFSAMEVMGVTALVNITNQAVNAGKRIVSALTIQPISTGWNEYELKMNSVQTIMASTGESIEVVNKYLNELNEYSDKTIYSFSDMTQNIGKFTNAGVALEDAVMAMKGISNEAALSGANANEASRAMYNLAQSISMGYVQYIDWKSIENANMATVGFKEQLLNTALALDVVKNAGDGMYTTLNGKTYNMMQMFKDGMKDQWLTTEVLLTTLKDYADETTEIGAKATEAATKVKTFSHMLDTLKEAAQSGWAQTWEIIFGDFEEGTTLWTGINNVLGGIIDKMSDMRNTLARSVFGSKWDELTEKVKDAGLSVEDFEQAIKDVGGESISELIDEYGSLSKAIKKGKISADTITKALKKLLGVTDDNADSTKTMTKSMEDYEEVVKRVMRGEFDNAPVRYQKLTEAGYDWAYVQNKVNEQYGSTVRHLTTLTEEQLRNADSLSKMSEEALRAAGYTDEQIEALKELQAAADGSNSSISELINSLEKPTGRELVIDSFSNAFAYLSEVLGVVKDAWNEIFGELNLGDTLYNIIEQIHEFTESLTLSEKDAANFKAIWEGVFAGMSISTTIFGASLKSFIQLISAICTALGTDLLEVGGYIGRMIKSVYDWMKDNTLFIKSIGKLGEIIAEVFKGVHDVVKTILGLERVKTLISDLKQVIIDTFGSLEGGLTIFSKDSIITKIQNFFTKINEWIRGIDSAEDVGKYIVEGLVHGLLSGTKAVIDAIMSVAVGLYNTIRNFFIVESPSKLMIALGAFIIAGLVNGISGGEGSVIDAIKSLSSSMVVAFQDFAQNAIPSAMRLVKTVFGKVLEYLVDLDLGTLIATGMGSGMLIVIYKLAGVAEKLVNPLNRLDGLFKSMKGTFDVLTKYIQRKTMINTLKSVTGLIFSMAITVAALAASLWVISEIPEDKLKTAGNALLQLVIVVAALGLVAVGLKKLGGAEFESASIVAFAATVLILAAALKVMSTITDLSGVVDDMINLLSSVLVAFILLAALTSKDMGNNLSKAGIMFLGLSVSLLIMATAIKKIGELESDTITKGIIVLSILQLFFFELVAVARTCGVATSKAGGMLLKMSFALLLMVGVIKLIGMLDYADIVKGIPAIAALSLVFSHVIKMSKHAGPNADKAGLMFIGMSIALAAAVICVKKLGELDLKTLGHGMVAVSWLGILFGALIGVSTFSGEHAAKAGSMLLMLSGSLLILTGVIFILGHMDTEALIKGVMAVGFLETLFAGLIAVTKVAQDCKATLIILIVAISLLTAGVVMLANIPTENLASATMALTLVIGAFAAMIAATKLIDSSDANWKRKLITLGVLTGVVMLLGTVVGMVANKIEDPEGALKTAQALALLMPILVGVLFVLTKVPNVDKNTYKVIGALAVLGLIVAEMGYILGLLNQNELNTSMQDVKALSTMLVVMAGILVLLDKGFKGTNDIYNALFALAGLGLIVGEIGVILGLLASNNLHSSMDDVIALSVMLAAMSAVLLILDKGFKNNGNIATSILALAGLGLVVGEIGFILGVLSKYDLHASLNDVLALGVMLGAMSGVLMILGVTSEITKKSWAGIGAIAVLGLVVGEIGLILGELKKHDMMASVEEVKALSIMLLAMSAALIILAGVGYVAGFALTGMAVLGAFIGGMAIVLEALGALAASPGYKEMINGGAELLAKIGYALGDFVGSIISGFGAGLMSGLPQMAEDLSKFMKSLEGFLEGAKQIDSDAMTGVKNLVEVITMINDMNVSNKIASMFGAGTGSMEQFSADLNSFAEAIVGFSNKLKETGFDQGVVESAAAAGESIAALYNALPKTGGWLSGMFGTKDLGLFSTQLTQFAEAIVGFSKHVSGENAIDQDAVKAATTAGELIAKLQDSLPETGGIIDKIVGMKDLGLFSANLVAFGSAIVQFSKTVSEGKINQEAVNAAKTAGDTMVALQETIPASDGVFQIFSGKQNLETFGKNITAFGDAMVAFSEKVSGEGAINEDAIKSAQNMGMIMTELQAAIPEHKMFDGKVSIDEFGLKVAGFGASIKTYSEKVSGIDNEAIANSTISAKELVEVAKSAVEIDEDGVDNFNKVKTIGTAIKDYAKKVEDIDTTVVSTSVSVIDKLISAISKMGSIDVKGVETFKTAVSSLGETNVKGVIDAFSKSSQSLTNIGSELIDSISKGMKSKQSALNINVVNMISAVNRQISSKASTFQQAGNDLMSKFASGISKGRNVVVSAIKTPLSSAITTANGYYLGFYNAGAFLVDGFAAGISANTWKAAAKASAMAEAAEAAAREALDINSPSKVFRELGYSVPEGFAIGIDRLSSMAVNSATDMAKSAINGVKDAVSSISNHINDNMDSQPTIRPVVDLSSVKTGIHAINGMFGSNPSIGVMSNINSVSSMMSQNNQNGTNNDIISEISKLRNALSNVGNGTTYNINGITYDDGSNVSNAVSELVRAVKIGGRA